MLVRPSHVYIDGLDKDRDPLPLYVDECVYIRAVPVFLFCLVVEYSEYRVVSGSIPFGGEQYVRSYLHLHHVLDNIKLEVISQIQCQKRERHHFRV